MILPKKLKIGDTIGVVSPSTPLEDKQKDQFHKGVKALEKMGFKIKLGENIFKDLNGWGISSGTPEQKANDINKMFVDNEVRAIITSIGGKTSNAVLDLLDYKVIKQNPKIFCGFSDSTTLVNAITNKTGLAIFYGCSVHHHFGRENIAYTKAEFLARFVDGYIGEVRKNSLWEEIRAGRAKGRLVGGSLRTIELLVGTEYFPKAKNSIFFIESFGNDLNLIMSIFYHFKKLGVWDKINGVVVGYNCNNEQSSDDEASIEDILLEVTKDYDFPILKVRDFGHRTECTPIPVGVKAKIDTQKLSFKILEKYVK